ncbi:acyl-CoA dehydrogenase family protein [Hyphomonas sp. FCG-A18]|uniref:acyl-CoA dehydrogenase family protein n=1 Tax=Hyphomonas sp. FCG-A18 TaxID=3080019 RepID=UPI002B286587|nr:acyl-CoA dehydrogenase family protein [Hyphomonas sp. FCG-A18]
MTRIDPHPTLAAALTLQPELAARAAEMEEVRRLPADLARKMAEAGLFRMVTPAVYGGLECSPHQIVETVEAVAQANASAGWCVMIGATTALNAAYMAPDMAREVYNDPYTITGGVFAPMGKAIVDSDDYILSGRWQWGSGSANCSWLCGGAMVIEDGQMRLLPSGRPDARMMIFPAEEAELIDTWHVMGLKGTGSGDIAVKNLRIPKARSVSLVADKPILDGALYAFPAFGLLSLGVSATAMGNTKGALNALIELGKVKKNQGSGKTLGERATVQAKTAEMLAAYRAARAYLFDEIDQTWDVAQASGDIPVERRAALRLACTHMVRTGAEITQACYDLGGGAALFKSSDLQRRFRDAHAMTQHIVTAPATWELLGRMAYGLETDASMV